MAVVNYPESMTGIRLRLVNHVEDYVGSFSIFIRNQGVEDDYCGQIFKIHKPAGDLEWRIIQSDSIASADKR
jgi:hypothetical protein